MATTTAQLDRSATLERVLVVVRRLLQELGSHGALPILSPTSHLDRDLGLGSLERVELLARLEEFQPLGRPLCLGVSRKGFLGKMLERPVHQRLAGSLAAVCYALSRGAAQILRVHDVAQTHDVVTVFQAIRESERVRK